MELDKPDNNKLLIISNAIANFKKPVKRNKIKLPPIKTESLED